MKLSHAMKVALIHMQARANASGRLGYNNYDSRDRTMLALKQRGLVEYIIGENPPRAINEWRLTPAGVAIATKLAEKRRSTAAVIEQARAHTAAVIEQARAHTAAVISRAELVGALGHLTDWGDPYGPPVYISKGLYDAGVAAGYDMRIYEVQKPIPIAGPRTAIYRRVKPHNWRNLKTAHLLRGKLA